MKRRPHGRRGEGVTPMEDKLTYAPKSELTPIAQEVLDLLRTKELPVWQVKEILTEARRLADWAILK